VPPNMFVLTAAHLGFFQGQVVWRATLTLLEAFDCSVHWCW